MITIHATKKLYDKLPAELKSTEVNADVIPADDASDPLDDWNANLITINRRQCLLLVHKKTRFPVFVPAVKKSDLKFLPEMLLDGLAGTLESIGLEQRLIDPVIQKIDQIQIDRATDRSVLGTMNQFSQQLEYICMDYDLEQGPGYSITARLARNFCSSKHQKGYINPAEEMAKLLGASDEDAGEIGDVMDFITDEELAIYTQASEFDFLQDCLQRYSNESSFKSFPELHGLMTGVLLCQRVIFPSEWLPLIWGGEENTPAWDSIEEAQSFQTSMMEFYNNVAEELNSDLSQFEVPLAIIDDYPEIDGSTIPWCDGFVSGFSLDISWQKLPEEAHAAFTIITLPFLEEFRDMFLNDAQTIDEHPEKIRDAVQTLFYHTRLSPPADNVIPFRSEPKVGRNDPCPCGSGKKYKKCCLH